MERGRSFSGGWKHSRPPRIATVKPVSKSFSEDDLLKCVEDRNTISPRVINRLKVQDLTILKKDNLISELEKCLGELEEEHVTTNKLVEVYGKVESERNELLDELDVAFEDLQEYMGKQKEMEEQNTAIESDRDELIRENEYLKAVLSNRTEIRDNKLDEENRTLSERSKELESKNTQLVDEINDLYEERQTLISSLLNLRSEEVDDVIRRSRSSSIASRDSSSDADRLKLLNEGISEQIKDLEVFFDTDQEEGNHESCRKTVSELNVERLELKEAFKRVKKERDTTEKELDRTREEKEKLENIYADKMKESDQLIEERNEKNLNISELKLEKRTLQRQLDHMRESHRATATKLESLTEDNDDLRASLKVMSYQIDQERQEDLQLEKYQQEIEASQERIVECETKIKEQEEQMEELRSANNVDDDVVPVEDVVTENTCDTQPDRLLELDLQARNEDLTKQLRVAVEAKNTLLEEQSKSLDELRADGEQLRRNIDELQAINTEVRRNNDELQGANKNFRVSSDELRNKNDSVEAAIDKLQKTNEGFRAAIIELEEKSQRATHEKDNVSLEKDKILTELRARNDNLVQQLQQFTLEKDGVDVERNTAFNDLQSKNEKLTEQLSRDRLKSEQDHHESQTSSTQLKEQLKLAMKEKECVSSELQELSKELKVTEEKLHKATEEVDRQRREVNRLDESLEASQNENKETRDNMLVLRKEKDEVTSRNDRLNIKLQQEGTRYNKLDLLHADLKLHIVKLSNNAELNDKQTKNRVNTLEIEVTKVTAAKETVDKLLKRKELDVKNAKSEIEALKQQLGHVEKEIHARCERASEEKFEAVKKENETLKQKCQQHEKSISKYTQASKQTKQTIDSITQKNQSLEVEVSNFRNNFNTVKIENERVTKKIRQLERNDKCDQLTLEVVSLKNTNKELLESKETLTQRIGVLESQGSPQLAKSRNDEREKYTSLLLKYDGATKIIESLNSEKINLNEKIEELQNEKHKMERDVQYILRSRKEEAENVFSYQRNEIEHERDTIKAKYELQRVGCDKMNKERDHYLMTINTLREENGKLHEQIRKQRLISSSTQDLMIQRLRDENETLEKQIDTFQQSLSKCVNENKELILKLQTQDDNTITTIRSLKARKNELQIRVSTLSQEKEQLQRQLKTKTDGCSKNQQLELSKVQNHLNELEVSESNLKEQMMHAHAKIAELELDNTDYGKKLQESERLMYDLQTALAQANDLTMQKSVEGTKFRRQMEMKNEHLAKENTELKRKIYFAGKSNGEISPTSLFPVPLSSFNDMVDGSKSRKVSLPTSTVPRGKRVSSVRDNRPYEYPMLEAMPEVLTSKYGSSSSSQVEQDLSQQLRELLDLTNDLTKTDEEMSSKASSDDSTPPPPVPPPPRHYETIDRKTFDSRIGSTSDDVKIEDWV